MMKILITLAFIVSCWCYLFVANKFMTSVFKIIRSKRASFLITMLFTSIIALIYFVQYWLLTGIFPVKSMLILFSALILSQLIYEIFGSLLGITIAETMNKIRVLTVVRGFEFGLKYPWVNKVNAIMGLLIFVSWIIALVIYWTSPVMTTQTTFWISFCIFVIPTLIGTIIGNEYALLFLASTKYDNDLRNEYFIKGFNSVLSTTVFIMLPIGLFYNYQAASANLPPYWLVILSPLLLFVLLTILPFFVGSNKFHHQQVYNVTWLIDWLNATNSALLIPGEEKKKAALQERVTELETAIDEHETEHQVLAYIDESDSPEFRQVASGNPQFQAITELFTVNRNNIHKWDIRASYLKKLQALKENMYTADEESCKVLITQSLASMEKERERLSKTKNHITGLIITATTTGVGFALKYYQEDLLRLFRFVN